MYISIVVLLLYDIAIIDLLHLTFGKWILYFIYIYMIVFVFMITTDISTPLLQI